MRDGNIAGIVGAGRMIADARHKPPKDRPNYAILHQDERIVVFDKAPGVATIPERYMPEDLAEGDQPKRNLGTGSGRFIASTRITSGVVSKARDAESTQVGTNDQFEHRETEKVYAAVVEGEMMQDEMMIDIPLAVDSAHHGRMKPSARGKESLTVLQLRERFRSYSLHRGSSDDRSQHQIRCSLPSRRTPLAVDPIYGNRPSSSSHRSKRKYRDYGREESR